MDNYNNSVYIHCYYSKCVNIHNFRMTDVGSFVAWMCKIHLFFYYARVYKSWCECSKELLFSVINNYYITLLQCLLP